MATESDTAGHHLEHPTLAAHLTTIHRGDPTPTPPCPNPHPPGPPLHLVGHFASARIAPHHTGSPISETRQTNASANRSFATGRPGTGYLCPGTAWCDIPEQPHPVAPGDLTIDDRAPQATGEGPSDGPAVICRAADSRKR